MFKLEHSDDDHALASWNTLALAVWRKETRVDAVEAYARLQKRLAGAGPVFLLQIVEEAAPPPAAPARAALLAMLKSGDDYVSASALVHEGDSLRASAVRAFVTGLSLVVRPGFPHKVFGTVNDAAGFLMAAKAQIMNANVLARAVANLRGR